MLLLVPILACTNLDAADRARTPHSNTRLLDGTVQPEAADTVIESGNDVGGIGLVVVASADLDGDTHPDVVATGRNAVYLFRGPLPALLSPEDAWATLYGDDDSALGESLAVLDMDGDGHTDLALGDGGPTLGAARIFYGPVAAGYHASTSADATIEGSESNYLGVWNSLRRLADITGDGIDELGYIRSDGVVAVSGRLPTTTHGGSLPLLVARSKSTPSSFTTIPDDDDADALPELAVVESDVVYILDTPVSAGKTTKSAKATIKRSGTNFGAVVADVGDLDGDGWGDVAVVAHRSGSLAGGLWIFDGPIRPGTTDKNALATVTLQVENGDLPGVVGAGDVDGDGHDDLLVGERHESDDGEPSEGRAYLLYGPLSGAIDPATASGVARFEGLPMDGDVDLAVSAGDLDEDGYADLLLGGWRDLDGHAWMYRGGPETIDADGDGWASTVDCDDSDADSAPERAETCDDVDNDCDGAVDEDTCVRTLTTAEVQAGGLVITEIMANPSACDDAAGEWVELYNATGDRIDLLGLTLRDAQGTSGSLPASVVVEPGAYVVLGTGSSGTWGCTAVSPQAWWGLAPILTNSGDQLTMLSSDGRVIDQSPAWTSSRAKSGVAWAYTGGTPDAALNDQSANWSLATTGIGGSGEKGTPGASNL